MSRSTPIDRGDAVLAVRLWALAVARYHPTMIEPTDAPEPVSLYAGLEYGGDPVTMVQDLAAELAALASSWTAWRDELVA